MIIHHASYRSTLCAQLINTHGLGHGVVAPSESSHNSMLQRANGLSASVRHNDFRWYRDPSTEPTWIASTYGSRASLRSSSGRRMTFMDTVASEIAGPLISLTGHANDGIRAREYAREMVQLRHSTHPGRKVYASFVLERQGLTDNSILASFNPIPRGVDGVALSVQDVAAYPSVWSEDDWYGWLRLIRGLYASGYDVLLPYSDVRGVVGMGVGAREFGSGPQQDMRQLRPAQKPQSRTGAQPAVSYLSLPLLAVVHGSRVSVDPSAPVIESHSRCSNALGQLGLLHTQAGSFDQSWLATGLPQGRLTDNRIAQHLLALASAEHAIAASSSAADLVEQLLEDAATLTANVPADLFKNSGTATEINSRLRAYKRLRQDLTF